MDHLAEARKRTERASILDDAEWAQLNAQLATAHALIAIAERLPPPTERPSERSKRLRQEEQNEI